MRVQNVRLTVADIDRTWAFYVGRLGIPVANHLPEYRMLALSLAEGFILRFDEGPAPRGAPGLHSIGIEFADFDAVDRLYADLHTEVQVIADLRSKFADQEGPYGFIVTDPDGYRLKLFRYNEAGS